MKYSFTVQCKDEKEVQEVIQKLKRPVCSCQDGEGRAKDMAANTGAREARSAAEAALYEPKSERTRLAFQALSKCALVSLSRPSILESWALAFPHVDLAGEIAKAEAWAQSKDVKRSPKGWAKALNSWLGKAQDKARGGLEIVGQSRPGGIIAKAPIDPAVEGWARE